MCPDKIENLHWIRQELVALRNRANVVLAVVDQQIEKSAPTAPANGLTKRQEANIKSYRRQMDLRERLMNGDNGTKPKRKTA